MTDNLQEKLAAEFLRSQVTFRPGRAAFDKQSALPLAYIDARNVMDRLDSVVGSEGWQDRYEFHGARTICYLSISVGDEWITKADGAGDTNIEGEKGGISDALKRAAVKWGIGRYLYRLKFKYGETDTYEKNGKKVIKGFAKVFTSNPWSYLISDGGTYDRAVKAAQEQVKKIVNKEVPDAKIIGAFQKRYPDLSLAIDMVTEAVADGYPDLHKVIVTATDKIRGE